MSWRLFTSSFVLLVLVASESLASPALLPGDPRLDNHDHHGDHHHHHDDQVATASHARSSGVAVVADNHVIHDDGSYSYNYQLSDGSFSYSTGDASGAVAGRYGYKTADGQDAQLEYTAGIDGFRATGPGLPKLPEATHASASSAASTYSNTDAGSNDYDYYDENADRSYAFGFEADGYNREETADSQGNVVGSYSYVDAAGIPRTLRYTAGSQTGYVAEADFLPVHPESLAAFQSFGQKTYAAPQVVQPAAATRIQSFTAPAIPTAAGTASGLQGYAQTAANPQKFYAKNQEQEQFNTVGDASYAFGYSAPDAARQEVADADGNVKGSYEYTSASGEKFVVRYSAGRNTGFVVENQEELDRFLASSAQVAPTAYAGPVAPIFYQQPEIDFDTWNAITNHAFSYESAAGSRSEESQADGNVRGTYTTIGGDGQDLLVRYSAGPNTGFVIENLDEIQSQFVPYVAPVAAVAPVAPVAPAARFPIRPQASAGILTSGGQQQAAYVQTHASAQGFSSHQPQVNSAQQVQQQQTFTPALSTPYSFGYNENGNTRKEESDGSGNVQGQYSYVNAEGNVILVQYRANANEGFVIENEEQLAESVEKATFDGARTAAAAQTTNHQQVAFTKAHVQKTAPYSAKQSAASFVAPSPGLIQPTPVTNNDVSLDYEDGVFSPYSFGYNEFDSSRSEERDDAGNVRGQYSYVNAEGNEILVRYRASPTEGFVIENEEQLSQAVARATLDASNAAASAAQAQPAQPTASIALPVLDAHRPVQVATSKSGSRRKVVKKLRKPSVPAAAIRAPAPSLQRLYSAPGQSQ